MIPTRHAPLPRLVGRCLVGTALLAPLGCSGALGLEGRYEGSFVSAAELRETRFAGATSVVEEREELVTTDAAITVRPGIDHAAILEGLPCPAVPLVVDGDALVLDGPFTCTQRTENETSDNGQLERRESATEVTVEAVTLQRHRDTDAVSLDARLTERAEFVTNGMREQETRVEVEVSFVGAKVANRGGR